MDGNFFNLLDGKFYQIGAIEGQICGVIYGNRDDTEDFEHDKAPIPHNLHFHNSTQVNLSLNNISFIDIY